MSLCVALKTSDYWSASIGHGNIYANHWTTRLSYVCQYHSKSLHGLSPSVYQSGFTDSCSRAVVRRTLVRGQFTRPFFTDNIVRGVSCSPDSHAHGQLAAHQSTVNW